MVISHNHTRTDSLLILQTENILWELLQSCSKIWDKIINPLLSDPTEDTLFSLLYNNSEVCKTKKQNVF